MNCKRPAVNNSLPWPPGHPPLLLAPMQGITNRAMRSLFIDWVRPDVVFTEFMRVNSAAPVRRLSAGDLRDVNAPEGGIPLVAQLIGHGSDALVSAARAAQAAGAMHINLNMGCPYGRMTSGLTGGGLDVTGFREAREAVAQPPVAAGGGADVGDVGGWGGCGDRGYPRAGGPRAGVRDVSVSGGDTE